MNLRVWFLITIMILSFSAGCASSGSALRMIRINAGQANTGASPGTHPY